MAEIAVILELVEEEIDQFCQTTFINEAATTRVYSGNNTAMISLGYYLRTLTSVWLLNTDGTRDTEITTECVAQPNAPRTGCYRWIERRKSQEFGGNIVSVNFPDGLNNVEVKGDWGFTTCPGPIKKAAALSVKHFFLTRDYDSTKASETGINRTVDFIRTDRMHYLHPQAIRILEKWQNRRSFSE
jgi:hypothetical protein